MPVIKRGIVQRQSSGVETIIGKPKASV
jgi:hypothetical protein